MAWWYAAADQSTCIVVEEDDDDDDFQTVKAKKFRRSTDEVWRSTAARSTAEIITKTMVYFVFCNEFL